MERSKEFIGNSICCIDVHPTRPEFVIVGYQHGQLVLIDLHYPEKAYKIMKDHHRGASIVNLVFCDWYKNA